MPNFDNTDTTLDLRFGKALTEYLRRSNLGERIDREQFLASHSEIASMLRDYFDAADEISSLAGGEDAHIRIGSQRFPCRFGDFELLGEIARGGRGVVYRALQLSLNRLVAIKMILDGQLATSDDVQRFRTEAHAVASLQHVNIVAIHDIGEHDGKHYISMELIDGRNLDDIVREQPLPGKQAAIYVRAIAEAIQYAHVVGLLHRDLKPSNVIIDKFDRVKVTDFGFAKRLESGDTPTITGQILGTPSYMPPEQALGDDRLIGPSCDIYAMGAVLYELLTGRPPFRAATTMETLKQVIELDAPRPRTLNPNVPHDLETITLKCLSKEPERRYKSAAELADDLSRYIGDEPILARPPSISERVWRWSRRNRGSATAILLATVALGTSAIGGVIASNALSVSSGRESLLQLQSIERNSGWFERMWSVVKEASLVGKDHVLQSHAALSLCGVDAQVSRQFREFGADQVVWDKNGKRLLIATITNSAPIIRGIQLWNVQSNTLSPLPSQGSGPIGFSQDGHPVQLVIDEDDSALVLWDLENTRVLRRLPPPEGWEIVKGAWQQMAIDCESYAVVVGNSQGEFQYAVWRGDQNPRLIMASPIAEMPNRLLTLNDDGTLLAVSESLGEVKVFSIDQGKQIAKLNVSRHQIHALTFSRDRRRVLDKTDGAVLSDWIIATGDAGGKIALWDLASESPLAFYHGSLHDVYQVVFSPDGMTVGSSGRGPSRIWDLATGRQLLEISSNDYAIAMAFSPDGERLAIGSQRVFSQGDLSIWNLDFDRGVQSLRGLVGPISKVCFSSDGSTVCALSHDWQAGLWNVNDGQLKCIYDVPPGRSADNAALILNKDGSQLAYCSGKRALLIDVETSSITKQWELPVGWVDLLAFVTPEQLILIRSEVVEKGYEIRIRDLLGETEANPIASIEDVQRHVFGAALGPSGPYLVVEGMGGPKGESRLLRAYDFQGQLQASLPTTMNTQYSAMAMDESGRLVAVQVANGHPNQHTYLFELPSGEVRKKLAATPLSLAYGNNLFGVNGGNALGDHGISLYKLDSETRLVTFDIDAVIHGPVTFNSDASLFAWGRRDGTVRIAQLAEVNARLSEVGLGW